ncbi:hypothetical protein F4861DRAFT_547179 [Xylaria intraflava]|nr:hypothetical protein F4861DRAFT_547179 [Xylaria intraflava]
MSQSENTGFRERQQIATKKLVHPSRPPPAFWDNLSEISKQLAGKSILPATQFVSRPSPAKVRQIQHFASHGGPDLSDIRGFQSEPTILQQPGMSSMQSSRVQKRGSVAPSERSSASSRSTRTTRNIKTGSIGPHDHAFEQHLINNGIYHHGYRYPETGVALPKPGNLEEIKQVMRRPRASLSPTRFTEKDFDKFQQADINASKESKVMSTVIPIIEGKIRDSKCVSGQIPFTNLDHLTDGTLVAGNPDQYHGARPEQLNQRLEKELSHSIAPSTQKYLPIAPNFFLAVNGMDCSLGVADRQARYDGALGARGMHSLQTYGRTPGFDNNAYTITSTYQGGVLRMYTSHPVPPSGPNMRPKYAVTQLGVYALNNELSSFTGGAAAYRNARDWAKQKRDEAIQAANEIVTRDPSAYANNPTASSPMGFDDTSADELAR